MSSPPRHTFNKEAFEKFMGQGVYKRGMKGVIDVALANAQKTESFDAYQTTTSNPKKDDYLGEE